MTCKLLTWAMCAETETENDEENSSDEKVVPTEKDDKNSSQDGEAAFKTSAVGGKFSDPFEYQL